MKVVECKACGSRELAEEGGIVVCTFCQSRYVPDADHATAATTVLGVASDIQALLEKCRQDPANSRRYASLVLDMDPSNAEARAYLAPPRKKKWWQ